jgi:hypothetical protein
MDPAMSGNPHAGHIRFNSTSAQGGSQNRHPNGV